MAAIPQVIDALVQFTGATDATWDNLNVPLPDKVIVIATDTGDVKRGDGTHLYADLPVLFNATTLINYVTTLNNKSDKGHTHAETDIVGLIEALADKANKSDVQNNNNTLINEISNKAPLHHTHTASEISDLANYLSTYGGGGSGGTGGAGNDGYRDIRVYLASAGQTLFTVSYANNDVDVYAGGVRLLSGEDYTATNGTAVVLTQPALSGQVIMVIGYIRAIPNRRVAVYSATDGQTTFNVAYANNDVDVYLNGFKLHTEDYTANNGTSITLAKATTAGQSVVCIGYTDVTSNRAVRVYTATDGQTTFAVPYTVPDVDVYIEGVKLIPSTDYLATDGSHISLTAPALAGQVVTCVGYTGLYNGGNGGSGGGTNTYTPSYTLYDLGTITASQLTINGGYGLYQRASINRGDLTLNKPTLPSNTNAGQIHLFLTTQVAGTIVGTSDDIVVVNTTAPLLLPGQKYDYVFTIEGDSVYLTITTMGG